ncbi:hypothetical protein Pcinc_040357, partial [Petrolisthes cinctipes]
GGGTTLSTSWASPPSGVIVLRNKAKVGNYFWPRISKVYFRGRFFMLRVRDKNNSENTYGFETPSKAACKHLWQCCVEHHAFFRLTQASGNTPAAIFSLGSKFSGRTEKEAVQEAKLGSRTQPEFTRIPSRRYQRRIVEGAQDTPRVEDIEVKPETRRSVQLPTPVSTVSHMYRSSASLAMGPRSDSPRSTRSAPQPMGRGRGGAPSPRSVRSAATTIPPATAATTTPTTAGQGYVSRRTSSVDSQSSVDSRGHRSRQRRGRARSSDGESEASSKCSSRCHRHRHRHRHSSDDPDNHRHRRRRHRHKSGGSMVNSEGQWAQVQAGEAQVKGNTATVRDLSHKSGYQPSGIDTEADSHHHHHHSNKKRHRKHRSRSRSPSEAKNSRLPEELRRHLDLEMQRTQGLSEAQMRQIPYSRVETAKTIKIKYTSPKTKRHKSPRRSKSNSSDRKATPPADGESPPPPYTPSPAGKTNTLPKSAHKEIPGDSGGVADGHEGRGGLVNGSLQSPDTRVSQATSRIRSPEGRASESQRNHEEVAHSGIPSTIPAPVPPPVPPPPSSTQNFGYSSPHKPIMVNGPSVKTLVTGGGGANVTPSPLCHDPQPNADTGDDGGGGGGNGPGFPQMKSGGERGSQFTAVLKPQSSPQSSVTSGISVGSSSVSISADSSLTTGSHHHRDTTDSHLLSSTSNSPDPDRHKRDGHSYENLLFDFQNSDSQTTCDTPEPYYSNCGSQSDTHRTQGSYPSPSPNLEPLTQHSTNILIHYHDNNDTLKSPSQLSNSQPVPLPRSSIISSVHNGDSSMHIVQSYGPSISNGGSKSNTNSLQRSGLHSATTKRASANSVGVPLFPSSMSSSPAPSNSSVNGFGSSSTLPRQMKPLMRTTGSQTNIFRTTASQTNHTNPRATGSASETTPSVHGTNLAHSALHWKVYNWDAYREEAEWSNSLGHTSKGQGTVGNQHGGAVGGHGRRGSAGSLELILGPLIQSALQHQQR